LQLQQLAAAKGANAIAHMELLMAEKADKI